MKYGKTFEVGETYILHSAKTHTHFAGKAIKRTKCKVTFELSEVGKRTTRTSKPVTLSISNKQVLVDPLTETRIEELRGTIKPDGLSEGTMFYAQADDKASKAL